MTTHDEASVALPPASRLTRRRLLRNAAGATAAAAGAHTLSAGPRRAFAQDKTKISLWFPFALVPQAGEQLNTLAVLINEFNAQSADVEVEVVTSNWIPEKLVTAVAGGEPPDLFYMDRYLAA